MLSFLLIACLILLCFFVATGRAWAILGWIATGLALPIGAILTNL